MTESSTTILRRMLDERGIEYESISDTCTYVGETQLTEYEPGIIGLQMRSLTPEQAIAATLGGGECTPHGEWESITQSQEVRHVFCDCGYELGMDERDSWPFRSTRLFAMPNYCQECGRKIRKVVKP